MSKKLEYYPLKPKTEEGFLKAVAWFGGRELIASLKGWIIYTIYGENNDPRAWMNPNIYPNVEENLKNQVTVNQDVVFEIGKNEVIKKVDEFWALKTHEQWNWKRNRFQFWEEYLEDKIFWNKLNNYKELTDDAKLNYDEKPLEEFWFDYIADTGDGQMGVYSVACLCFSDLWLENEEIGAEIKFMPPVKKDETGENTKIEFEDKKLLPRGSYLFVGGDTAYHAADYTTLFERFQSPFRWAFMSVRMFMWKHYGIKDGFEKVFASQSQEPEQIWENGKFHLRWDGTFAEFEDGKPVMWDTEPQRPIFGVPANHDYYDALAGFNKQFRRPPFKNVQENRQSDEYLGKILLKIHSFSRQQEASFTALHLPFDWWMLGIDSENKKLDFRQEVFYREIIEKWKPNKLILATPEPTTVFGRKCVETDKTAVYLSNVTKPIGYKQPFLNDGKFIRSDSDDNKNILENSDEVVTGKCRLDLSGDVHHYARYWGPAGKGFNEGEFNAKNYASLVAGGGGAFFDTTDTLIGKQKLKRKGKTKKVEGEIPPQALYPGKKESINKTADRIFDLWNVKKGGYVQIAGSVIAVIIYFCLIKVLNFEDWTFNFSDIFSFSETGLILTLIFSVIIVFFIVSGFFISKLVETLNYKWKNDAINEDIDGRFPQMAWNFFPVLLGVIVYILLLFLWETPLSETANNSYSNSWYLLFHFAFAGALIWTAQQYAKWLLIASRYSRIFDERTRMQDFRAEEEKIGWFKRFWKQVIRDYDIVNLPSSILYALASFFVISGIVIFGKGNLATLVAEIIFTITFFGGLLLISLGLGLAVGGSYHKGIGKAKFFFIGFWHAILQLLTPFILVYYFNWSFVLFVFVMILVLNGFSNAIQRLGKKAGFRLGAEIMKRDNPALITAVWVFIGSFMLITPIILHKYYAQTSQGLNTFLISYFPRTITFIRESYQTFINYLPLHIAEWIPFFAVLVGVALVGYRLSRVWLSWYLAVSLAFNGHNNEAGGLARIQGFKHILRIRTTEEKVTVYVIGIDEAKPELEQLKLRLVDKFDLECC